MRIDPTPGRASTIERLAAFGICALLLTPIAWLATPIDNWDMLAYLAVAARWGGADDEAAHRTAYRTIRDVVPSDRRDALERATPFRETVARDPAAFGEQLAFYAVKPLFPLALLGAQRAGLDPLAFGRGVARVSFVALGLLLFAWLTRIVRPAIAAPLAVAGAAMPPVVELARLFTPDAASAVLVLASLWFAVGRAAPRLGLFMALVSIPLRPDNAMFVVLLAALIAILVPQRRRAAAAVALAAVATYVALGRLFGGHPWSTLFFHTFVEYQAYPASFDSPLRLPDYARIYLWRLHPSHLPPALVPFTVFGVLATVHHVRRRGRGSSWVWILGMIGVYVAGHWLLFPDRSDRFFVVPYLVVMLATAAAAFGDPRVPAHASSAVTCEPGTTSITPPSSSKRT